MIGHLGNKYKAFRASKTGNVDIRSGEATSFKTNLKDRVQTSWTDIKTKAGDVKVQVGEGFDNFKNRVSNMKNRVMASGAEKVSEKLENLNAELGVRKQNFQRNLAAMQGQRELEFQLSGETPGIGVTTNYSERLENLTKKIQQFSVEHRQKIQNFEGRGGGCRDSRTKLDDGILVEAYKILRKNKAISGQAHHLNQNAAFTGVIPHKEGLSIKLEGNVLTDIGSPHYKAHESLEQFWDQYRKGGELYGISPTMAEYNVALEKSLIDAGLTPNQAKDVVSKAIEQQISYGLTAEKFVPRIPGKMNLPKIK